MTTVMTIVMNRLKPREELRQAIYEAAIALFRDRSYAAATVDEIVAKAGVAKGTFFNFFPTKLHVIKAYYAQIDIDIARRRRATLDPNDPLTSLARYGRDVEKIIRREGALMLELIELSLSSTPVRDVDEDSGDIDAEEFADFLSRARDAGRVRPDADLHLAADALINLWSGAVRAWRRDPAKAKLGTLFAARAELLFAGIGR